MVQWKPTYNTGISGPFQDQSTGCTLHFKSGDSGEEWQFELTHKHVAFDVSFGGGDAGLTGFLSGASGGKMGEQVYSGTGNANINVLPQGWRKVYFFICMLLAKLSLGYVNILGVNT